MHIVMLGHSSAGKTTYMASMYREMSTDGIQGFRVRARDEVDHRRLLVAAANIRRGQYPPPSDQRHEYALSLRHAASPLIDFSWKDYRGGALTDRSSVQDTGELLADLRTADAIVLFMDSVDLQRSQLARRKVRDLTTLVYRALQDRSNVTPIVIVLTKSDLVDVAAGDRRLEPFEAFINGLSEQERVIGTVIEVACGPQPQNVAVPVLFCLFFGLHAEAEMLVAAINRETAQAAAHRARDTLWNRTRGVLFGETTERDKANQARSRAYREYQALEPLLAPGEKLEYMLGDIKIFGGVSHG